MSDFPFTFTLQRQRMDTWAHSNTLRLRNSPRKVVAQGSAAREEQRLRPQPWARLGGQPMLRTVRGGGGLEGGLLCLTRPPSGPQGKRRRGDTTAQHTHLVRSPLHGLQQQPLPFPGCRRFVPQVRSTHRPRAPVQRGVAPGTLGGAGQPATPAPSRGSGPPPPPWFQFAHRLVSEVTGLRTQPERLRAARRRWCVQESERQAHKSQSSQGGLPPRKRHRCNRPGNTVSKQMLEVP